LIRIFFITLLLIISTIVSAQKLHGIITNDSKEPLTGCSISLFNSSNVLVKTTLSDANGFYNLDSLTSATYRIKVSYTGYEDADTTISLNNRPITFLRFTLKKKVYELQNTEIKGYVNPVKVQGDTTSIKADGYKTNPDANADDLVTKMPGITTQDGKVQAQGEDVKQVLVDGKPFLGGSDPNAVLKNIPADLIDMVQVFDRKSDQSLFTGVDDGNSSKTINIITKAAFRNGTFGRVYAGIGTDNRYKTGAVINDFNKDRRLTVLFQVNNINEQNFSMEDLSALTGSSMMSGIGGGGFRPQGMGMGMGMGMGSGMMRGPMNMGNASNFMVDQLNGVARTYAGGFNYSNKWKNIDFTASYFFNQSKTDLLNNLTRQFISSFSTGLNYLQADTSLTDNINHRANMRVEVTLDSANSVLIQPRFSLQKNIYRNRTIGSNILASEQVLLSSTSSNNRNNYEAINISVPLLFKHSFKKAGRTFSLNLSPTYNVNSGNNLQFSEVVNYSDTSLSNTLNLYTAPTRSSVNINTNATYTEALNSNNFIVVSYLNNLNSNLQRRLVYDRSMNPFNNYTIDTTISTELYNDYNAHSGALAYRYQEDKFNFSIGTNYQYAYLSVTQNLPVDTANSYSFNTILPSASFQYKFSKTSNLRINYRTQNNAPRADQLTDAINVSNPLSLSSGNSLLKQDFQHFLFARYMSSNTSGGTSFFLMMGGSYTSNYIANNLLIATTDTILAENIILSKGAQYSKPQNLNAFYSGRFYTNYGFSIKKLKLKINTYAGSNFSNTPGIINTKTNQTLNRAINFGLTVSSNISEKIDFTLTSNGNLTSVTNQLQPQLNTSYTIQTNKLRVNMMPWKGLVLQTDILHQYINGLSDAYNTSFVLLNAAVGYKFLKNKSADIRLYAFDLLGQNRSIARNVSDNYYEDTQSNVLTSYYMLIFTYNIRSFRMQK
jgi:hypothetical protein